MVSNLAKNERLGVKILQKKTVINKNNIVI